MGMAQRSIRKGLEEAIAFAQGKASRARVHIPAPVDVKAIREKTGLTQVEFAARFGFSLGTLRHWERGDRQPRGPALILLHVVDKEPRAVLRALAA